MRYTEQQIDREMFYHQVGSNRLMACQTQLPFVNTPVTTFTAVRCCAITRAGHRCSISSTSHCRDQRTGRLAARPLQQGSRHCLFHARPFCTVDENLPRFQSSQPPVIIYFDLETTSLLFLRHSQDTHHRNGSSISSLRCCLLISSSTKRKIRPRSICGDWHHI